MKPNVINISKAFETLANTGEPEQANLPETTGEKLLWVLDTCYGGIKSEWLEDILKVSAQADADGKSAIRALGLWADHKMNAALLQGHTI